MGCRVPSATLTFLVLVQDEQSAQNSLVNDHDHGEAPRQGSQLAAPLPGGLAPLIATALLGWSAGRPWPIALYMIGTALITFCSVFLARETVRSDLSNQ